MAVIVGGARTTRQQEGEMNVSKSQQSNRHRESLNWRHVATLVAICAASLLFIGCGSATSGSGGWGSNDQAVVGPNVGTGANQPAAGSTGITQAGAQDFGRFRKILEAGNIPGPETIDDLGFFAEHKLDYPKATCGENLCLHGLVGVMGNMINGANCTLIQLGMNSPIQVDELERPPLHLVIAVDRSGSMDGQPIEHVRTGMERMLDHAGSDDHFTLVTYSNEAMVQLEHVPATDKSTILTQIGKVKAGGGTNIFAGLFRAYLLALKYASKGVETRVVLLSDGLMNDGIIDANKLASLAATHARLGIGLTTIGLGNNFDIEVMRLLAEVGAGNFYFLEDAAAAKEVFTEEVQTFLHPVALDVRISMAMSDTYVLGGAYGTNGFTAVSGGGEIAIPALFLAKRQSAKDPIDGGRRGGGGAILMELLPLQGTGSGAHTVGDLKITWEHPVSGDIKEQTIQLSSPHAPGQVPDGGYFTSATSEKGFVMLNIYMAFKLGAELAGDADLGAARSLLEAVDKSVTDWLGQNTDPDISDDQKYLKMFIEVLKKQPEGAQTPAPQMPPPPWPAD